MQDATRLLQSWNSEFKSRCDRVRLLIGHRHWLSDGRHKEEIVADHLRKYVGPAWTVGSGFIIGDGGASISPELDIYLDDPRISPPILADGSIRIAPVEGVAAFIEVKSTLTGAVLDDVIEHQRKVLSTLRNHSHSVWCGAVFFQMDGVQERFLATLKSHFETIQKAGLLQHERKFCFAVLEHHVTFLDTSNSLSAPRLKQFSAGELSIALALADLFDFLSRRPSAEGRGSMQDGLIQTIDLGAPKLLDLTQ